MTKTVWFFQNVCKQPLFNSLKYSASYVFTVYRPVTTFGLPILSVPLRLYPFPIRTSPRSRISKRKEPPNNYHKIYYIRWWMQTVGNEKEREGTKWNYRLNVKNARSTVSPWYNIITNKFGLDTYREWVNNYGGMQYV